MTATPQAENTAPQLSVPEGQEGLASPDQQDLVREIEQEGEISEDTQQILNKFKSTEDLAKSYAELQKKFTQNQQQKSETDTTTDKSEEEATDSVESNWPESPEKYTKEIGEEFYGSEVAQALDVAGVNPVEMCDKFYAGEDVSNYVNDIVEKGGLPRGLVERYLAGSREAAGMNKAAAPEGITAEQEQQIKDELGGDDSFEKISQWASKNLSKEVLDSYNETIDSGNAEAIRWAVRSLQIEMANPKSVVEPKLYGGGDAPNESVYESKQQVLDAMNKKNSKGERYYDIDPAYQRKVSQILARSDVGF